MGVGRDVGRDEAAYKLAREVGARLLRTRERMGLNQTAVASLCGVSSALVCAVESGYRNLNSDSLLKLSKGLGVSVDWLLGVDTIERAPASVDPIAARLLELFSRLTAKERVYFLDFLEFMVLKHEKHNEARRDDYRASVGKSVDSAHV